MQKSRIKKSFANWTEYYPGGGVCLILPRDWVGKTVEFMINDKIYEQVVTIDKRVKRPLIRYPYTILGPEKVKLKYEYI